MAESNIIIKGTDNLSSTLKKIQANQTEYRKNVESLDGEIQRLTKNYGLLEAELTQAKKGLAEAKKAFSQTEEGAENYSDALEEVVKRQSAIKTTQRNMQEVSKALRTAERDMRSLTSTAQKMDNQLASTGAGGASGMGGLAGAVKSLAAAGLGNMLGGSIAGLAGSLVTSAFGSTTGGIVSSVAGNAVTGAAMGSILGPVGAAVGGLVGAISGAIEGITQAQEKVDSAYRTYVENSYNNATEQLQSAASSGSTTAASREMYAISFRQMMGEEAGQEFFDGLRKYAETTPFEFDPLVSVAQALTPGFGDDPVRMMSALEGLGDAASALGKSESDMAEMARALARMETTDKTTLEYLNLLTERGVNAIDYLAEALGGENGPLSTAQVYDMISKGEIAGTQAVEIITQGMQEDYGGATAAASNTYTGKTSNLEDAWANIYNAAGEGYNETRMAGIDEELAWLEENGERLQEAYRQYGEYQAELDNAEGKAKLQAYEEALDTLDRQNQMVNAYADAFGANNRLLEGMDTLAAGVGENFGLTDDDVATMMEGFQQSVSGASVYGLLGEAIMEGDAAFYSSDVYTEFVDENVDMINAIQGDPSVAQAAMNSGYYIAEELTKGIAQGLAKSLPSVIAGNVGAAGETYLSPTNPYVKAEDTLFGKGYAVGLPYVPYDDFPALLHEGERVLTRGEAAAYDAGGGGIQIVVNGLSVREEADVSRIAQELARQLALTARSYTG